MLAICCSRNLMRAETEQVSQEQFDALMAEVSNWGRWGRQDERGALNLITPAKRLEAAALVREGISVSLARNVIKVDSDDSPAFVHKMVDTGENENISSSDIYSVLYHGFTVTHLDALCHVFYKGEMYNGFSQKEVTTTGAGKLSVIEAKEGIFTRGVLLDIPLLLKQTHLQGGQAIYPRHLDAWERRVAVPVASGDAVFIRTGRWTRRSRDGPWKILENSAGLHVSCVPWLKQRDISILASDLAADLMPSEVSDILLPVHVATIVGMGTPIIDNCDLEALSAMALSLGRYEFLLTASPLPVEGGTGSPLNPVATF